MTNEHTTPPNAQVTGLGHDMASSSGFISPLTFQNSVPSVDSNQNTVYRSPVRSASQVPSAVSRRSLSESFSTTSSAYVEQSRALMEQQRKVSEQERALFAQERKLWDTERQALSARIKELEVAVESNQGRRSTELSPGLPSRDLVSSSGKLLYNTPGRSGSAPAAITGANHYSKVDTSDKFWEGLSSRKGSAASRTFSDSPKDESRLPCIVESESPTRKPGGIDISHVQTGLDGITLKLSAVAPDVIAKVMSPSGESALQSPSPTRPLSGKWTKQGVLSSYHPSLTKDAGHTPMARHLDGNSSGMETPIQAHHLHRPSVAVPREELSPDEQTLDDDPELQGPFGLVNNGDQDKAFLNKLNTKLLVEARKVVYLPSETSSVNGDEEGPPVEHAEPEVRLKIKRSMNFGSAFGAKDCGKGY
ncbi:MAG: hypothetical protein M1827_004494 [Pycnora praestabilis]|nr:MAG: hypothetical protein M1827_004494 [Pycnora praestabilis]